MKSMNFFIERRIEYAILMFIVITSFCSITCHIILHPENIEILSRNKTSIN